MKKAISLIAILAIFFVFLTNCKKEETPETDSDNNQTKYAVQGYKLTSYTENEPVPTFTYSSRDGDQVTYYCTYNSAGEPVKLTHYIYEDGTDIAKIVSFDDEGDVNVIYEQNVLTDEVFNRTYVRSDETASYFTEGGETTVLTEAGDFTLPLEVSSEISNSVIHSTLLQNQLLFARIDAFTGNAKTQLALETVVGIVVGGYVIYKIITTVQDNGVSNITEGEEISSNSVGELYDNICDKLNPFSEKTSASGQYMCNETPEKEEERKNSTESEVDLCGNDVCVADCNGDLGGTAYYDDCQKCVGGTTGRTECSEHCNGELGGIAFVDACDVCAGGSTNIVPNSSCEDCNGVIDGTAYLDDCEECVGGNTGKEPCEVDCNGVPNGTASEDQCGVCSGGNTNIIPNESCTDCNGEINGTAYIDNCEQCVGGGTGQTECNLDCNGVENGSATVDQCGVCSGGNTGVEPDQCVDCNGEILGNAYIDNCDDCVGGNTGKQPCNDEPDCNGDPGGEAYLDMCNQCVGGNTGQIDCTDSSAFKVLRRTFK